VLSVLKYPDKIYSLLCTHFAGFAKLPGIRQTLFSIFNSLPGGFKEEGVSYFYLRFFPFLGGCASLQTS
jgi:hypothetical protein